MHISIRRLSPVIVKIVSVVCWRLSESVERQRREICLQLFRLKLSIGKLMELIVKLALGLFSISQVKIIAESYFVNSLSGLFFVQCLAQEELIDVSSTTTTPEQPSSFYTAAVLELYSPGYDFSDPKELVDANLEEYLRLVYEASSKGADILVFPEATLNYFGN